MRDQSIQSGERRSRIEHMKCLRPFCSILRLALRPPILIGLLYW